MLKQVDRVVSDLSHQRQQFGNAGGTPLAVGIVGINQAARCVSYEGEAAWPTDGRKYRHPCQEAAEAERRLLARAAGGFDEFLFLRYLATNVPPYRFEWTDEARTERDYAAALTRLARKYDARF